MGDDRIIEALNIGFLGEESNLEVLQDFLFRRGGTTKSSFAFKQGKK